MSRHTGIDTMKFDNCKNERLQKENKDEIKKNDADILCLTGRTTTLETIAKREHYFMFTFPSRASNSWCRPVDPQDISSFSQIRGILN